MQSWSKHRCIDFPVIPLFQMTSLSVLDWSCHQVSHQHDLQSLRSGTCSQVIKVTRFSIFLLLLVLWFLLSRLMHGCCSQQYRFLIAKTKKNTNTKIVWPEHQLIVVQSYQNKSHQFLWNTLHDVPFQKIEVKCQFGCLVRCTGPNGNWMESSILTSICHQRQPSQLLLNVDIQALNGSFQIKNCTWSLNVLLSFAGWCLLFVSMNTTEGLLNFNRNDRHLSFISYW